MHLSAKLRYSVFGVGAAAGVNAGDAWLSNLFREAFHIIGDDDLRWVSLTDALQVF